MRRRRKRLAGRGEDLTGRRFRSEETIFSLEEDGSASPEEAKS
jgi:hypothetical protein